MDIATIRTVKAVPIVNSFPCATYTRNDVAETKLGAQFHIKINRTELSRATVYSVSVESISEWRTRTFQHPLHLDFTSIEYLLDPTVLPREELDELDCTDELIEDAHALITRSGLPLLDAGCAFCHKIVEGPTEDQNKEANEG